MAHVTALFRTFLELSLGCGAVAALLLCLRPVLGRRYSARWAYWAWLVLALRLVVPWNPALPQAPVRVPEPAVKVDLPVAFAPYPGTDAQGVQDWAAHPQGVPPLAVERSLALDGWAVVAVVWCVGCAVGLVLVLVPHLRFRRAVRRWSGPEADGAVQAQFDAVCQELGVRGLALRRCSAVASPMVTGLFRPALLLPSRTPGQGRVGEAVLYGPEALDAVFRHEAIHVLRGDLWYKLLLLCARTLHWFNPLVWLMVRRAERDLELTCDERAVAGAGPDRRAGYGRAILDAVEAGVRDRAPLTTRFRGGKGAMLERLKAIIDGGAKRRGTNLALLAVLAALGVAAAVSVGGGEASPAPFRVVAGEHNICDTGGWGGPSYELAYVSGATFSRPLDTRLENGRDRTYCAGATAILVRPYWYSGDRQVGGVEQVLRDSEAPSVEEEGRTRRYYFPYGGGEAYCLSLDTGYFSEAEMTALAESFTLLDDARDPDVSLTATQMLGFADAPRDLPLRWVNGTAQTLTTAGTYRLERLDRARWVPLPGSPTPGKPQTVEAHAEAETTYPVGDDYGKLEGGYYRVAAECGLTGYGDLVIYSEFSVDMPYDAEAETPGVELWRRVFDGYTVSLQNDVDRLQLVWESGSEWRELQELEYGQDHPYYPDVGVEAFSGALGAWGFRLFYREGAAWNADQYWTVDPSGEPVRLAKCWNTAYEEDLDGDGTLEVLTNYHTMGYVQIYDSRDGQIWAASVNDAASRFFGAGEMVGLRYEGDGKFAAWRNDTAPQQELGEYELDWDALEFEVYRGE